MLKTSCRMHKHSISDFSVLLIIALVDLNDTILEVGTEKKYILLDEENKTRNHKNEVLGSQLKRNYVVLSNIQVSCKIFISPNY